MKAAKIISIRQETPTVKSFRLATEISFRPGQWVDLYIDPPAPGRQGILGGFSITSSPLRKDSIELAIKKIPEGRASVHMHERARVGDELTIDGGHGDFYYEPGMGNALVLVAGGIGITPLMSIIRFVDEKGLGASIALCYSARTPSELVFLEELKTMASRNDNIRCHFTVTRPGNESWTGSAGRIGRDMLADQTKTRSALYYVCGPSGFAQDMGAALEALGVEPNRVKSEVW